MTDVSSSPRDFNIDGTAAWDQYGVPILRHFRPPVPGSVGGGAFLPSFALLLIFVVSAVVIWSAGTKLSDYTDVLAERLHLGEALAGVVLLAVATNLPEIAITVSAALSGQIEIAVGNLLGGIALQTVVLVALDAFGVRELARGDSLPICGRVFDDVTCRSTPGRCQGNSGPRGRGSGIPVVGIDDFRRGITRSGSS